MLYFLQILPLESPLSKVAYTKCIQPTLEEEPDVIKKKIKNMEKNNIYLPK